MNSTLHAEIVVVGAGPAGTTAARVLAEFGHQVLILEKNHKLPGRIGESLAPSITRVFDTLKIRHAMDVQGFYRPQAAHLKWGARAPVTQHDFGSIPGYQVDRARFDLVLLEQAQRSGAKLIMGCHAQRPTLKKHRWFIPVRHPQYTSVTAHYLVDAAGKASSMNREPIADSLASVALYAYWKHHNQDQHTHIESTSHGWIWAAPLPDKTMNVAYFIDQKSAAGLSADARLDLYTSAIRASSVSPLLDSMHTPLRVCDATSLHDANPISIRHVRVGEACHAIDPLSSQGVQNAMMSAWRGAICAHTDLSQFKKPCLTKTFYENYQLSSVASHIQSASVFYNEAAQSYSTEYWLNRRTQNTNQAQGLKPHDKLGVIDGLSYCDVPVLENCSIESKPGVRHPHHVEPFVYLDGKPIRHLLKEVLPDITAKSLLQVYVTQYGEEKGEQIFAWLVEKRLLVGESR